MSDKQDAILNATLALVSEHGFHGTSMSMIAKAAGVSAGIIYHYFENKDALMLALYGRIKRRLGRAIVAGFAGDMPLRDGFRQILLTFLNFYMQRPHEAAFVEQFSNSPYMTPHLEAEFMDDYAPVLALIERAIREGVLKQMPFEMIAIFTSDVAMALAKKHIAGELVLDDALKELAVKACWDALKA
ncbi:MAG: TetR/AcrR family transcriptional regulator [Anaerolineae bacterium]|nr:TetR/AcrR family transcriptional regulator [Anaerolineae bacterium]